ncbi:MAG: hypothetical protein HFJ37_01065 [Clostridia bacterium]|nr:hypothetical protein [Clostridia bacterium]
MNQIKDKKGVTLITLVITIIVLLLLAGVTMATLAGENGILNQSSKAKTETEIASIKEEIQVEILKEQKKNRGDIVEDRLKKILENYGILSNERKLLDRTLTTTKGNYQIKVSDIFDGTLAPIYPNPPNMAKFNKANTYYVTWDLKKDTTTYEINDKQTNVPDNWYDYENGKWANIKTSNSGLEAYWVWIPRYEYVVPTSVTATQIEVKFISKSQKEADEGYTIHPAFTNEGNGGLGELDGIWVAKFEAVSNTPTAIWGGGNNPNLKVQVKPNQSSWRNIEVSNAFLVCRRMTSQGEVLAGSTVDSHMMKNTEWGAVAILSQSQYGVYNPESINGEKGKEEYQIWNNSSGSFLTGSVGIHEDTSNTSVSAYDSINGPKASTTGTIYGVYDMAGGAWEYVAACLSGQENAKFGVQLGDNQYVDLYTNTSDLDSDFEGAKIGDATKETKGWNRDVSSFVCSLYPIFKRGGSYHVGTDGGVFAFHYSEGITVYDAGFRVVLVP